MAQQETTRRDKARSYRFRDEDLSLIDRIRTHLANVVGVEVAETDILRSGLRAYARELGIEKSTQPKKRKGV